jgi:hypothetical protein
MKRAKWRLIAGLFLGLAGCARMIHNIEDMYLEGRWQPRPLGSEVIVTCRVTEAFDGAPFQVSYDRLRDVTRYPSHGLFSFPDDEQEWCRTGIRPSAVTRDRHRSIDLADNNTDPSKGAVENWDLGGVGMDGASPMGPYITFRVDLIKGERLPLGGAFNVFHLKQFRMELLEPAKAFSAHGLQWRVHTWQELWWGGGRPNGTLSGVLEIYQARIGDYSLLIYGTFNPEVVANPHWFAARRALLRAWVESFRAEPVQRKPDGSPVYPMRLSVQDEVFENSKKFYIRKRELDAKALMENKDLRYIYPPERYLKWEARITQWENYKKWWADHTRKTTYEELRHPKPYLRHFEKAGVTDEQRREDCRACGGRCEVRYAPDVFPLKKPPSRCWSNPKQPERCTDLLDALPGFSEEAWKAATLPGEDPKKISAKDLWKALRDGDDPWKAFRDEKAIESRLVQKWRQCLFDKGYVWNPRLE